MPGPLLRFVDRNRTSLCFDGNALLRPAKTQAFARKIRQLDMSGLFRSNLETVVHEHYAIETVAAWCSDPRAIRYDLLKNRRCGTRKGPPKSPSTLTNLELNNITVHKFARAFHGFFVHQNRATRVGQHIVVLPVAYQ